MNDLVYTDKEVQRVKRRQTVRVFAFTILVAAVALFVADNTDDVSIGYLFDRSDVPLIIALLATWAAGVFTGLLIAWHVQARPARRDEVLDLTDTPDSPAPTEATEETTAAI